MSTNERANRDYESPPNSKGVATAVFDYREKAEAAVADLLDAGFDRSDVGIASRNLKDEWAPYLEKEDAKPDKVANGAAAGAVTGAGIGGLWALGIAAGVLPGIGPAIAGGVLASVLASTAVGLATGGFVGALIGLGLSEEDVQYYEREFNAGGTVVSVKAGERYGVAASILRNHGGRDRDNDHRSQDEIAAADLRQS